MHRGVIGLGQHRGDRVVPRALGDPEVDRSHDREADRRDHLECGVEHAVRAVGQHALVGHEDVLEQDVVARGAAHAERVPVVEHGHTLARDRHGHVEHAQALLRIVVREHRREHCARDRLAREHLPAGDAVAAVDLGRGAARVGEVGTAGGDEHDALVGDPAQGGLGAGQPAAVAPRGEGGHVLVHRGRERRRGAVLGEFALHHRDLADGGAVTAEFARDRDREQPLVAQVLEGLAHPRSLAVVALGVLGEHGAGRGGASDELGLELGRRLQVGIHGHGLGHVGSPVVDAPTVRIGRGTPHPRAHASSGLGRRARVAARA